MSTIGNLKLEESSLYVKRAERAKANKPPIRSNALGAVAQSRFPNAKNREEMVEGILAQDRDLVVGNFGTVYYKPAMVCGIELKLEPLQPSIGTAIHGIDLAKDLDNLEMITFLRQLWLERRVLLFREQNHLSRTQMVEFAKHFGEVGAPFGEREHMPNSPYDLNQEFKVPDIPEMLVLPSDETVPNAASSWHCDATWQARPPMGSILMCREAPPIGGDTCFCDCYSMWEGLPLETKKRVEYLTAVHEGTVGHQMDGKTPVAVHPVARTHPETGRTTLYVQQGFVRRFADEHDVPEDEAKALLLQMKLQEGRPEYTCRVKWEAGSIAMWDNRAVLHSASGDFWPHRRLMERLTILDYDKSRRTPYYAP
ncbi:MAG: TauD/TfdA family dioxygenase [Pseudomonadota bacterium]